MKVLPLLCGWQFSVTKKIFPASCFAKSCLRQTRKVRPQQRHSSSSSSSSSSFLPFRKILLSPLPDETGVSFSHFSVPFDSPRKCNHKVWQGKREKGTHSASPQECNLWSLSLSFFPVAKRVSVDPNIFPLLCAKATTSYHNIWQSKIPASLLCNGIAGPEKVHRHLFTQGNQTFSFF